VIVDYRKLCNEFCHVNSVIMLYLRDENGETCCTHRRNEKFIESFGGRTSGEDSAVEGSELPVS
jgi:hypothetical protein